MPERTIPSVPKGVRDYDAAIVGPCKTIVQLDAEEMGERGVGAAPTFFIGGVEIVGVASSDEKKKVSAVDCAGVHTEDQLVPLD